MAVATSQLGTVRHLICSTAPFCCHNGAVLVGQKWKVSLYREGSPGHEDKILRLAFPSVTTSSSLVGFELGLSVLNDGWKTPSTT